MASNTSRPPIFFEYPKPTNQAVNQSSKAHTHTLWFLFTKFQICLHQMRTCIFWMSRLSCRGLSVRLASILVKRPVTLFNRFDCWNRQFDISEQFHKYILKHWHFWLRNKITFSTRKLWIWKFNKIMLSPPLSFSHSLFVWLSSNTNYNLWTAPKHIKNQTDSPTLVIDK